MMRPIWIDSSPAATAPMTKIRAATVDDAVVAWGQSRSLSHSVREAGQPRPPATWPRPRLWRRTHREIKTAAPALPMSWP